MNKESSDNIFGVNRLFVLLFLLILFHIVNNLIILSRDNTPLFWDGGEYFYQSLKYYDVFANFDSTFLSQINNINNYRPPIFPLTSLPLYLFLGKSTDVAVMTNAIFLTVLIFSVFGIGKILHKGDTGLLASFIVSTFPILYGLSRSYWSDLSLTAMVSLSIYFLLLTDYFRDRKYSIFFGVSIGIGMLTKWTYFVFLTGPFLYFLIVRIIENPKKGKMECYPALNATIAIVVGVTVASLWYVPNGLNVAKNLIGVAGGMIGENATRFQQLGESIGPSGIFNARALTFYAGKLVNDQITFFYAILFAMFTLFLLKKGDKKIKWTLLLWIIVPVIVFTIIKNKTPRNTVAMLPAISLMIALGTMNIKREWVRKSLVGLIVVLGLFQFTVNSYGTSYLPNKISIKVSIGEIIFFQQYENTPRGYVLYKSDVSDWKTDEILMAMDSSKSDKQQTKVFIVPEDPFTFMALEYSSYLMGLPYEIIHARFSPQSVLDADYVLVKNGGFLGFWFSMRNIHHSLDLMENNIEKFTLIKSVVLPWDRTSLPIYDNDATKTSYKSGIIFSNELKIIEYSVIETNRKSDREYNIKITLKKLKKIDEDLTIGFSFLNKKRKTLIKRVEKIPISTGMWKEGEVKTITFCLPVPTEAMGLEISFYDSSKNEFLSYRPEYLIFKRKDSI